MRKQIAKTIGTGILASFLAGTVFMIVILIIIDLQTPDHFEDGRPRMNCFGGLQYGIAAGIQIFLIIAALPAFLNLFQRIRNNKFLSFSVYFGGYILYLTSISASFSQFSGEEYLILIPWANLPVWVFYYFRMRKIVRTEYL